MGTADAPIPPTAFQERFARRKVWFLLLALVVGSLGLLSLLAWQKQGQRRAKSLSNVRRLAWAALLYAQDWDGRLPPPAQKQADGSWLTWPERLRPYQTTPSVFDNPANPLPEGPPMARHPVQAYPIRAAYALNRRFWDTFAPGPFPLENLEMANQTALLVEAGPMWREPRRFSPPTRSPLPALLDYGDTLDRVNGLVPYPSPHAGRMVVAAADGHAIILTVAHYDTTDGPHDSLYGRLGGTIFNWNGGHPNGETDRPIRE